MKGHVDSSGRSLITISIRASELSEAREIEAWIDTGFTGELVLAQDQIEDLGLFESGTVKGVLADGSEITLHRYVCWIEWFGIERDLEVVSNEGDYPLLGVELLLGHELHVNYRSGEIAIDY